MKLGSRKHYTHTTKVYSIARTKVIQARTEKLFRSLIEEFVVFVSNIETPSENIIPTSIENKFDELNKKWLAYCAGIPAIKPEGKLIFKQEIDLIIKEANDRIMVLLKEPKDQDLEGTTLI